MTQQIVIGPEIKAKIRDFKTRINQAEAAVLKNPTEENLAKLGETLEESRRWRNNLQ